jgi:hypothetical protein
MVDKDKSEAAERAERERQNMIASARDYLDAVVDLLQECERKREEAMDRITVQAKFTITLEEAKVTWLERLAAMMGVHAARHRAEEDNKVYLVFADTDGDAVLEEETGEPSIFFSSFEDISRMVVSVPKK